MSSTFFLLLGIKCLLVDILIKWNLNLKKIKKLHQTYIQLHVPIMATVLVFANFGSYLLNYIYNKEIKSIYYIDLCRLY